MKLYKYPNGTELPRGVAFTIGDNRYPPNWLEYATPEELQEIGITVEEVPDPVPPPPPPPAAPTSVTRYQALVALHNAGLLTTVETMIAASEDPIVKLAWANAGTFERRSQFIESLGPLLNLTEEQIDGLFLAASQVV